MIVFLTLLYVAALAGAVRFGLIKLNLFWKLSPLIWMLLLFVALFLPMQWGAPGGNVNVLQPVVEIVPNVSGEVIEVPVEPLATLAPGDVLFQIDPVPYQAAVDRLNAQLGAAIQNVERLEASADAAYNAVRKTNDEIDIRKTDIEASTAKVEVAETELQQAQSKLRKVTQLVADLKVQVAAGERELNRRKELLAQDAGSKSEVDRTEVQYTGLLSQLNSAESDQQSAEQNLSGVRSKLDAERANARGVNLQLKQLVDAELPRVMAVALEARLAADSMIGDEHTSVADVRAQLAAAQYDLDQTTVRAPSKGHVAYATLRPGQRVANLPMRSWMAFVDHEKIEIVVTVQQFALRHVRPGQKAEVTFKMYPGKVFDATVNRVVNITSSGQIQPSGQISPLTTSQEAEPFGVVLDIENDSIDPVMLGGGTKGTAAIYTDSMQPTHVIRRVMLRMDAWTNYILP
ncbi:Inner membrane protein YibH [Planctomycetes bacterium CA13]|uniref:Inner membrane protein YibH n=1 Tax=Novipirellula herctigrandis TaxID=2527986 RepID=A0A5C5Z541_9BACT|nr:Inner membrane protein YibH [Planctomycetes bacterium CA13]